MRITSRHNAPFSLFRRSPSPACCFAPSVLLLLLRSSSKLSSRSSETRCTASSGFRWLRNPSYLLDPSSSSFFLFPLSSASLFRSSYFSTCTDTFSSSPVLSAERHVPAGLFVTTRSPRRPWFRAHFRRPKAVPFSSLNQLCAPHKSPPTHYAALFLSPSCSANAPFNTAGKFFEGRNAARFGILWISCSPIWHRIRHCHGVNLVFRGVPGILYCQLSVISGMEEGIRWKLIGAGNIIIG